MMQLVNQCRSLLTIFLALTLLVITSGIGQSIVTAHSASGSPLAFNSFVAPIIQTEIHIVKHSVSEAEYQGLARSTLAVRGPYKETNNGKKDHCDGMGCVQLILLNIAERQNIAPVDLDMTWPLVDRFLKSIATFDFERPPRPDFAVNLRA
jgi:hypothetical protein